MQTLRSRTIRLASSLPTGDPLRRELVALAAKTARDVSVTGKNIVGSNVRITVGTGKFEMAIRIQELPSKPLKRRLDRVDYDGYGLSPQGGWQPSFRSEGGGYLTSMSTSWLFGAENIAKMAGFSTSMDFKRAEAALKSALAKAVAEYQKYMKTQFAKGAYKYENPGTMRATLVPAEQKDLKQALDWAANNAKWAVSEEQVYYLDVEPHDYEPIVIKGRHIWGTFEWTEFQFGPMDDPSANPMEGMRSFYKSTSSGGARKLFKILKGDPTLAQNMTEDKFTDMLAKAKIAARYVPTVWR